MFRSLTLELLGQSVKPETGMSRSRGVRLHGVEEIAHVGLRSGRAALSLVGDGPVADFVEAFDRGDGARADLFDGTDAGNHNAGINAALGEEGEVDALRGGLCEMCLAVSIIGRVGRLVAHVINT